MNQQKIGTLAGVALVLAVASGLAAAQGWRPPADLKLDELAAKRIHEFALTMQPLKLLGGTGSTVAPAAIH